MYFFNKSPADNPLVLNQICQDQICGKVLDISNNVIISAGTFSFLLTSILEHITVWVRS